MKSEKQKVKSTKNGISARHKSSVIGKSSTAGITLIALVITIIVLLILAGITINLTIGQDGILKRAEQAGRNYTNAADYERTQIAGLTNEADDIIANLTSGSTQTTPAIDINTLKAGDYIKYDSGDNGIITCRVLYPATSEYGLQIISDKNVKDVALGSDTYSEAVTSYNNAIETLNNEAEGYINEEYAYDARCVGCIPTVDANGNFTEKYSGATTYVTLPFTNASYINSLDADENYKTDQTQMEAAGILVTGEYYWIASRRVWSDSYGCGFNLRIVNTSGTLKSSDVSYVGASGNAFGTLSERGLRPCISLKSDIIKITSGDGTSADTAYVIGK